MGQIGSVSLEIVCSSDDSPGHSWHGFMKWTGPPPMRVEGFGFVDVSAALSRSLRTELLLLLGAIIFDGSAARNGSSHRVFLLRFISGIDFLQLCRVTALVQLCRVTASLAL